DSQLNDGYLPSPCITGLEVRRVEGRWLRLDRNGHLDLWTHLTRDISKLNEGTRRLPAYALHQDVTNLCILAKALYEYCEIDEPLIAKLDIWHINGVSVRGKESLSSEPH